MNRFVVGLDSRSALNEARSGGKGASLARLIKQGFSVPPGFVITPAAFQAFLSEFEIQVLTQRRNGVKSANLSAWSSER